MESTLRVLIAEDTEDDALLLIRALKKGGYAPDMVRIWTRERLHEELHTREWDIILSDYHMPGFGGEELISIVRKEGLDIPIIIVSGAIGEEAAVALVKSGADDYVMKDNLIRLAPSISRALKEAIDRKERRRAEEDLRDSEERYRNLVRQISEGILIIDRSTGTIIESNEMVSGILGYTGDEILSMSIDDLLPGCLILSGTADRIESTIRRKEGEEREIEVSISRIAMKGYPNAVSAVIRDITERKVAERDLRIKQAAIVSSMNGIIITNLTGDLTFMNRSFLEMFHLGSWKEMYQKQIGELTHDNLTFSVLFSEVMQKGRWSGEMELVRRDGSTISIFCSANLVLDNQGMPLCSIFICNDITDKKELERSQIQAFLQIDRNIEQFAILADHIRNPLQVILGYSALSTDDTTDEVVKQVDRINEIIKQLDRGWIDSENVRKFLRRHYNIGSFEEPGYLTR
ncbi:PAS domain S-box protein [Methanocalculus taiwanensis]|uniref:PAS domain S-box protein n=1 Tax=Methanocalculus taiwanensis TaxID=106207 RepID=A0ABD4THP8_9EURY|nr:PAS domain S-box protein [Methanocalculus taiwanensis]MCQ1538216.1 PAS domain S-box protein [Methanocalculus taiwanensis]